MTRFCAPFRDGSSETKRGASHPSLSRPTLDLYTTQGEGVLNTRGTRRTRAAKSAVEASRIRGGIVCLRGPIGSNGSLIVQLTIGVETVPRHGEEKFYLPYPFAAGALATTCFLRKHQSKNREPPPNKFGAVPCFRPIPFGVGSSRRERIVNLPCNRYDNQYLINLHPEALAILHCPWCTFCALLHHENKDNHIFLIFIRNR